MAHKIKITLDHMEPPVHRTCVIPEEFTFDDLHILILITIGWDGSHLYEFSFGSGRQRAQIAPVFENEDSYFDKPEFDANLTKINEILPLIKNKIEYMYDFGDSWKHTITFMAKPKEEVLYPICIKGEGDMMVDDCGSYPGYEQMRDILRSKKKADQEEKSELLEWLGIEKEDEIAERFDFNLENINEQIIEYFC